MGNMHHFKQRLAVSGVSLVFLFGMLYLSFLPPFIPIFAAVTALAIGIAQWEYYRIAQKKNYTPMIKLGITAGAGYALMVSLAIEAPEFWLFIPLILGLFFMSGFIYFFYHDDKPLSNFAITVFGVVYIAIPLSFIILINYYFGVNGPQDGRWWLLYALTVTKMTDAGAYFVGKLMGKNALAAHISPQKTVEGAVGGLIIAIISSIAMPFIATALSHPGALQISLLQSVILGTLIGIFAQIGDLGESLLKRDAGVKDSNDLPGLGGMLDMADSLIFTLPLVYFFLRMPSLL